MFVHLQITYTYVDPCAHHRRIAKSMHAWIDGDCLQQTTCTRECQNRIQRQLTYFYSDVVIITTTVMQICFARGECVAAMWSKGKGGKGGGGRHDIDLPMSISVSLHLYLTVVSILCVFSEVWHSSCFLSSACSACSNYIIYGNT